MFDQLDDTIAAVSSPPGRGARGIIRLSGPRAFELAAAVFVPDEAGGILQAGGHQRHLGRLRLDDHAFVPAEAYTFRAPTSYTRQDVLELHTIGSPPLLAAILEQLTARGARAAEPGEFTARAFFSGAIDLTRVEGVAAMIHAQTDAQLRASEALLHGFLSRQTRQMRDELADLLALIEADIDFAEEPIEFVSSSRIIETAGGIADRLDNLLRGSASVERLEFLPRVVLLGLPNAGKSTLFNRLTGIDRVIQSAIAGTTRDVITAPLVLSGGEAILCDTAGLAGHGTTDHAAADPLIVESIESATRQAVSIADLILAVIDAGDAPDLAWARLSEWLGERQFEIVLNKLDLVSAEPRFSSGRPLAAVSARTGQNIDQLRSAIGEILFADADMRAAAQICLSNRHRAGLEEARDALLRAARLCEDDDTECVGAELLALEIRHAMHALSLLLGAVTNDDVLARIFGRFCIGK